MAYLIVQIVGWFISLFLLYTVYLKFKKKDFKSLEFLLWGGFWLVSSFLFIFPKTINPLVEALNVKRPLDLYTVAAVFFITGVTYLNYAMIRRQEGRMVKLVREVASWRR